MAESCSTYCATCCGRGRGVRARLLGHRQTKGADNGQTEPTATAPHLYSTGSSSSRDGHLPFSSHPAQVTAGRYSRGDRHQSHLDAFERWQAARRCLWTPARTGAAPAAAPRGRRTRCNRLVMLRAHFRSSGGIGRRVRAGRRNPEGCPQKLCISGRTGTGCQAPGQRAAVGPAGPPPSAQAGHLEILLPRKQPSVGGEPNGPACVGSVPV